jgi:aminoglycoside phosphotransferase (APT) family kinase protein
VQTLNVRALVETIFREEPGLPSAIDDIRFFAKRHTTVYIVRAGRSNYFVHLTPDGTEELCRLQQNFQQLKRVGGNGIPRVLAFRTTDPEAPLGQRWAVLVMSEVPGTELSSGSFSRPAWTSLCELLRLVHSALPSDAGQRVSPQISEASAFPDFAETFALHVAALPLRPERVRAHLDSMSEYVGANIQTFVVPYRLIHGDLSRPNIRVHGDQAGLIDWAEFGAGDYAYDLATLKFALDSVVPRASAGLIRDLARDYRKRFDDDTLELRLRFFLALPGLVGAFAYTNESALFPAARAWRIRTCYLHSEAQWRTPLRLDGTQFAAPVIRTEHWALRIPQPARGLFYLLAPKRLA